MMFGNISSQFLALMRFCSTSYIHHARLEMIFQHVLFNTAFHAWNLIGNNQLAGIRTYSSI